MRTKADRLRALPNLLEATKAKIDMTTQEIKAVREDLEARRRKQHRCERWRAR